MVCDINIHAEIKIDGQWHHYSTVSSSNKSMLRDYELFAKMAGVRRMLSIIYNPDSFDIVPISSPKGLPDDISLITKIAREEIENDGHHYSWFHLKEIKEIEIWWNDRCEERKNKYALSRELGYLFGSTFGDFLECKDDYPKEIEDVRWVFWFDG